MSKKGTTVVLGPNDPDRAEKKEKDRHRTSAKAILITTACLKPPPTEPAPPAATEHLTLKIPVPGDQGSDHKLPMVGVSQRGGGGPRFLTVAQPTTQLPACPVVTRERSPSAPVPMIRMKEPRTPVPLAQLPSYCPEKKRMPTTEPSACASRTPGSPRRKRSPSSPGSKSPVLASPGSAESPLPPEPPKLILGDPFIEPHPIQKTESVLRVPDEINAMAFKAFRKADLNGDGQIDADEFGAVLKRLYGNINGPDVNRLYTEVDRNRSGKITFDEFVRAVIKYSWDLTRILMPTSRTGEHKEEEEDEPFEWEIDFSQIMLGKLIGEGTFGVVYKAKWLGCPVAVKQLRLSTISKNVRRDFRQEISLMSRMRHPSIVLFMGATTIGDKLTIVTELVDGGSLYDIIHKSQAQFTLRWALRVAFETAVAMNYLHSRSPPIIHRDLKPMNILVDKASGRIKLIDFGLSCIKPSTNELKEIVGSPIWMAPEVLRGEVYTEKVDVYSYALCLFELFTGETPYIKYSFAELVEKVGNAGFRPHLALEIPPAVRSLIETCWNKTAAQRPAFREVVESKLFISNSQ